MNRYGMRFGRSRNSTQYVGSKRRWNGYYTHVCLRCGWAFKPPRHLDHRMAACDAVRAQLTDPDTAWLVRLNLFGPSAVRSTPPSPSRGVKGHKP